MIRPAKSDPFLDDQRVLDALRQGRAAAIRRHAAAGQPLIGWENGQLHTTDAVITEIKDGKAPGGDAGMGGMDD